MRLTSLRAQGRRVRYRVAYTAALSLMVAGCGSSAPLFTHDGRPTILVQCPARGPASSCMENARGMCGGDFDIIQQSITDDTRNLLFACKAR